MCKFLIIFLLCISSTAFSKDFNIVTFGANADGKTINTTAIQAAIDKCGKNGDRVIIPAGVFVTGTLYMKDGIELYLTEDAVLLGSASFDDYPENNKAGNTTHQRALIYGLEISNISITGKGTIDGNGLSPAFQLGDDSGPKGNQGRPELILMINCKYITVENVNLKNSAFWMQNYVGCENVHLKGLNIYNHANYNNDGIDIDCKNVLIEDCVIDSDDDGLCLKSHDRTSPCENVTIRNCIVASNCNAVKFGTTSRGGFRNINISNITIKKASEDRIRKWQKHMAFIEQPITVLAGIALENVDGGSSDNISISNIFMTDVQTPVFIKFGNRMAAKVKNGVQVIPPGHFKNIILDNITAISHSKMTSSITGFSGNDIENVRLSNINISSMGNGTPEDASIILPENEKIYPSHSMFGFTLPSSGMFIRHVKGISINNITLSTRNKDSRVHVLMEDVKNAQISLVNADNPEDYNTTMKLVDCRNISWTNPQVKSEARPFLELDGAKTTGIYLMGTGQLNKKNRIKISDTVPEGVITIN